MNDIPSQPMKRKLLAFLCALPWLSACRADPDTYHTGDPTEDALRQRFRDIGVVLVLDAVEGAEMDRVTIYNDLGTIIQNPTTVARRKRSISAVGNARIPLTVRATWREGAGWDSVKKVWDEGIIIGDYTVPVADRIPDSILDYIRENGGALRLKIRLKDDGILIGWDVERRIHKGSWCVKSRAETCFQTEYFIPGGDFLETKY